MSGNIRNDYLGWSTIASDPAIFNEILREAGVSNAQVEEVYSLDPENLESLKPILGLIFLFRVQQELEVDSGEMSFACPSDLWFANQVIENSCASLALLNIVFNCPQLDLGNHLESFKSFTSDLTPPLRGLAMYDFDFLRKIHNGYARNSEIMRNDVDAIEVAASRYTDGLAALEDTAYHFIAYVPTESAIYELDGLRHPVKLADFPSDQDWLSLVTPKIRERMLGYASDNAMFTLLAVVEKPLNIRRQTLSHNALQLGLLISQLEKNYQGWNLEKMSLITPDIWVQQPESLQALERPTLMACDSDTNSILDRVKDLIAKQQVLRNDIRQEQAKIDSFHLHAVRTKHDYTEFIRHYVKLLAEKDLIQGLLI